MEKSRVIFNSLFTTEKASGKRNLEHEQAIKAMFERPLIDVSINSSADNDKFF